MDIPLDSGCIPMYGTDLKSEVTLTYKDNNGTTITYQFDSTALTIDEALENYTDFLRAVGYSIDDE